MRIFNMNTQTVMKWAMRSVIGLSLAVFMYGVSAHAADAAESVYKSKCAGCHAADGSGNTAVGKSMKTPDLRSADVQKLPDEQLIAAIEKGKGKMPAIKSVTPDQAKELVAYIHQLGKK